MATMDDVRKRAKKAYAKLSAEQKLKSMNAKREAKKVQATLRDSFMDKI